MGRASKVTSYRLITAVTIAGEIMQLHGRKRALVANVLDDVHTSTRLKIAHLRARPGS